jgi:hypothetical protein
LSRFRFAVKADKPSTGEIFMRILIIPAVWIAAVANHAFAQTFSDNFAAGLNPTYWTVTQTTAGLYSVTTPGAGVTLAQVEANPGGSQDVAVNLDLAALGGSIPGNFSLQIGLQFEGGYDINDLAQLNTGFADSFGFADVFDLTMSATNVYVSTGSIEGTTSATASVGRGTFEISRTGSTITGSFDGTTIYSTSDSSTLTSVSFGLQTQTGSGDNTAFNFNNFSLTPTSVPEPGTLSLLAIGGLAAIIRRKRG